MLDRRAFLASTAALVLGACTSEMSQVGTTVVQPNMLVPATNEPFPVQPVDLSTIPAQFHRQMVDDPTGEPPGTIVVDPGNKFLYLVMEGGRAMRYGIGVGREGFAWSGVATIQNKQHWPKWFPPKEMQERDEKARQYANGMDGGPTNPLGARALYLYQNGKDTLYRIHGTFEPQSIGRAVSSGCIRLLNADVIDLYDRVPIGTRVVVRSSEGPMASLFGFSNAQTAPTDPDAGWRAAVKRRMTSL